MLNASEEIQGMTDRGPRTYRLIDIEHIVAAKLAAFLARGDTGSNDFVDIMWLVLSSVYGRKVWEISGNLSLEQKQAFMAAVSRMRPRLPAARMQRIRYLLRLA